MKRLMTLMLAIVVGCGQVFAEVEHPFYCVTTGVVLGASSYYMAVSARHFRRAASQYRTAGQLIIDTKDSLPNYPYTQRAGDFFSLAGRSQAYAKTDRRVSIALGICAVGFAAYGVSFYVENGIKYARKTWQFGGRK